MANALTAIRLLLALPFALCMAAADARHAAWAAATLAAAIASDLLDGAIARRLGTASESGRLFDHATDVVFVTSGLAAGAARHGFPWLLPAMVGAAFLQYAIDSYWLVRAGRLRPSRLGRYNGMLYFVPLGGDVAARMGLDGLRPFVTAISWLLIASTAISMAERLVVTLAVRRQRSLASPAEQSRGRSRR